ncbi:hypothetical protein [Smaragdicoccus niigatensis]|uniref:hypothetical protein n=1 Tax=Smaragdicoccus niigatensis TaxID=359359 RepID=UPI00035FF9D1|nr:hypothetical protein [Smaragdicoccus niigatensis]
MNVLLEMTALSLARPTFDASSTEIAAWFEAKACFHDHLAGEGGPDAEHERALATSARRRSLVLMGGAA